MATRSFLKTIHTISVDNAELLADAFEKAKAFKGKEVKMSRPVVEVKGEKIKELFVKSSESSGDFISRRRDCASKEQLCVG